MTQEMTAAERYASLKEQQVEAFIEASFSEESLKGVELYEVKCPFGMVFKCRKLDAAYSANVAATMPMALSGHMISRRNGETDDDEAARKAFEMMPEVEQRAAIQSMTQMVRYIAVSPRIIVGDVGDRKDAISSDMLTISDVSHLAKWAGGGDAAEGIKTFRRKRK